MFTIYGQENCVWCNAAKSLLRLRGYSYEFFFLNVEEARAFFAARPELPRTVPQIWHGEKHVGGYSELAIYVAALA